MMSYGQEILRKLVLNYLLIKCGVISSNMWKRAESLIYSMSDLVKLKLISNYSTINFLYNIMIHWFCHGFFYKFVEIFQKL